MNNYNVLVIVNIDDFFKTFSSFQVGHIGRFAILADLEEQIRNLKNPPEVVCCDYKDDGVAIFHLVKNNGDYVFYEYHTTAS